MKTIISGSRDIECYDELLRAIECVDWKPTLVISGCARGADRLGERWAKENNVPVLKMPADWLSYGRAAGYCRNIAMADQADALIALWDCKSPGTEHMIEVAERRGLRIFVKYVSRRGD